MNLQKNSSRRRQRTTAIPPTCVGGCIRLDTKASRYWRPPCSTPFLSWRRFRALRLPRQLRGNRQPSVLYLLKDLQLVRRARHTVPSLRSSHEQHQAERHLYRCVMYHHLRERSECEYRIRHQYDGRPYLHHCSRPLQDSKKSQ